MTKKKMPLEGEVIHPGPKSKYEPWMAEKLIDVAAEGGHIAAMMVGIGVRSKATFYEWMDKYQDFKEAYEYSKIVSQKLHEEIQFKGALGAIKNFNSTTFAMIMNNKFGDDYKRGVGAGTNTEITINQVIPHEQITQKIAQKLEQLKLLGVDIDGLGKG